MSATAATKKQKPLKRHPIRKNRKKWKKLLAIYYLYCYTQLKHNIPI